MNLAMHIRVVAARVYVASILALALISLSYGSSHAADLTDTFISDDAASYAGGARASTSAEREFDRKWTYLSAGLDRANSYSIGSSWLPNSITVGFSTDAREAPRCCSAQFTSSTLVRLGTTIDNSYFYTWGGLASRQDAVLQTSRSFWTAGAGLIAPLPENGQFFIEFDQKALRYDCNPLCGGGNLLSKYEAYSVRVGIKEDFAGLSDTIRKLLSPFRQPILPVKPEEPKTKFHGDH
jgi:hypothetical protein